VRILSGVVRIYSILVQINIFILQPLSPRRATTVSRTPLVAASDSHMRCSHTQVPRPAPRPCRRPRATCVPTTRVPAGGDISQTSPARPGDGACLQTPRRYAGKQPENDMRPPRAGPKGTWAGREEFGYLRVPCWANPRCKNWLKNSISGSGAFVGVWTWCYQRAVWAQITANLV